MTDAELLQELNLPEYAGLTAEEKTNSLNLPRPDYSVSQMVPKSQVLQLFGNAAFRIAALPEPHRTGWLEMLDNIQSLEEGLIPSETAVAALLALAVSAGVLTAEEKNEIDSLGKRPASKAEHLWGAGTTITLNDIAKVS